MDPLIILIIKIYIFFAACNFVSCSIMMYVHSSDPLERELGRRDVYTTGILTIAGPFGTLFIAASLVVLFINITKKKRAKKKFLRVGEPYDNRK